MRNPSAEKAARLLGSLDWKAIWQRHDDPVDFLVFMLEFSLAALGDAAVDTSARAKQRTAAAYALSSAIRTSANLVEQAGIQNHEAIPDAGLQESVATAVDALHRIAKQNPKAFRDLGWSMRWPVNLAADGKPLETCVLLHSLPNTLGARFTGFAPDQKKKRPPLVGGRWNTLALELYGRAGPHKTPLMPPRGRVSTKWPAWRTVDQQMEHERQLILARPEVMQWKTSKRVSLLKEGARWAELKKEIRRALLTLARNNSLRRK